jgi:hypothetical protein
LRELYENNNSTEKKKPSNTTGLSELKREDEQLKVLRNFRGKQMPKMSPAYADRLGGSFKMPSSTTTP